MSTSLKVKLGRAAIAVLIIMVGIVAGGIWGFGQVAAPLKGAILFGVIAFLVDRLITAANRKNSN